MYPEDFYGYGEMSEILQMLLVVYGGILLIALLFGFITYLLTAIGVFKMTRTLGLPNAWFAFVPIVNTYALGRIAEQCPTGNYKRPMRYGALLLTLELVTLVFSIVSFVSAVGVIVDLVLSGEFGTLFEEFMYGYDYLSATAVAGAPTYSDSFDFEMLSALSSIIMPILNILHAVFYYVALYKVYKLFHPNNAVGYLILSILIGITRPFLLFSLRKRMPCYAAPQPQATYPSYPQYPTYGAQPQQPPYGAQPDASAPQQAPEVSDAVAEAVQDIETPDDPQDAAAEDPWNRPE